MQIFYVFYVYYIVLPTVKFETSGYKTVAMKLVFSYSLVMAILASRNAYLFLTFNNKVVFRLNKLLLLLYFVSTYILRLSIFNPLNHREPLALNITTVCILSTQCV